MIKDLLAIVDTGENDAQFVTDVSGFADFHGAHLSFLLLSPVPTPDYALAFDPPYVKLDEYIRRSADKEARLTQAIRHLSGEVRVISGDVAHVLRGIPVHARYADLALIGPPAAYGAGKLRQKAAEAAMLWSGRPMLVLPAGTTPRPFDRLAIGWNGSREATRALTDAVALLAPGAAIDVLMVDGAAQPLGHGIEPGADIARNLARHGFRVTVDDLARGPGSVAETLVEAACARGADLLAIGGYAHSRLSEMILGGVTRDLFGESQIPCLFSH